MPVKDSIDTTTASVRAILDSGHNLTVYNDFSTPENTATLEQLSHEWGFRLVNLSELTQHPSPNYLLVLQTAQREAIADGAHLVIIESDVQVYPATIDSLLQEVKEGVGMVASVTVNDRGQVNFPYEYAASFNRDAVVDTRKRFSFCCTLLTLPLLQAFPFSTLNPEKDWFDVFISHHSVELGFTNLLMMNNPVIHRPHSSRPWKQLKYTHPLRYYIRKIFYGRDRI